MTAGKAPYGVFVFAFAFQPTVVVVPVGPVGLTYELLIAHSPAADNLPEASFCGPAESAQVTSRRLLRREMTPGALSTMLVRLAKC